MNLSEKSADVKQLMMDKSTHEVHNLCSSPVIIRVLRSQRIKSAEYEACMTAMHTENGTQ